MSDINVALPVVIMDDFVVFPETVIHFDIRGRFNLAAVELALAANKPVVLMSKNYDPDSGEDVIGTLAEVRQLLKVSSHVMRVMLYGKERVMIDSFKTGDKICSAKVSPLVHDDDSNDEEGKMEEDVIIRLLKEVFEEYDRSCVNVNDKVLLKIKKCNDLDNLIDIIASNINLDYEEKYKLLVIIDPKERCRYLMDRLSYEINLAGMRDEYRNKFKAAVDNNQKEYYLREQLKVIREELGDSDTGSEADEYIEKCNALNASEEVKEKILEEIRRFKMVSANSSESSVIRTYIETLLGLPWDNESEDNNDIENAGKVLEKNHYGLTKVKERILEYLAVRQLAGKGDVPIICLVGPPGTGKTSIAKSVAESLGKKYIRICLGGVRDEAEIRGHRKTYVGAMPGRIIMALKKAKTGNPLILLDEIDKVSNDYKGDTFSALLEVLDPEQNEFFTDHYVEVPVDLSKVLFICTANTTSTIPGPLLDRMEIIEVSGYTENEKYHIAKKHLVSKQKKKNGIGTSELKISDSAIRSMITGYTREAGVRSLERTIARICRKAAKQIVSGEKEKVSVTGKNIEEYLGKVKYEIDYVGKNAQVGVVRGLAWTSVGGDTLEIEVNIMPGKGELLITGKLGDVMKESASAAVTYVRSLSERYNIADDYYSKHDIHIHVPEGAVPKDGPSAGITMATAVLSAVTDHPVKAEVAMTGEVTLRGRVLPIGGLKEKLLAACNAGIKTVIVPERNRKTISELEEEVTGGLNIVYADSMEEVARQAIVWR